jgi:hypothetical protein
LAITICPSSASFQLDEKEDTGIKPDRNYESTEGTDGDTTKTDEINVTGNAKSGPREGP